MSSHRSWPARLQLHDGALGDLVLSAADGLVVVDRDGTVRFVNPAAEALLGRPAEALVGEAAAFPMPAGASQEWVVPGREQRVVEIRVAEVLWEGLPASVASLREITQRKRQERHKDELLNKVAHELRTPLTSIQGSVTLLLTQALGPLTAEQRDFLQTVTEDLDRLVRLLNNILDLSKIEAGYMVVGRQPVHLEEIVEEVCRSFQALFGLRAVRRELAPVPPVYGDHHLLFQVLVNLVANAVKFTAENGTIIFRLASDPAWVSLSIVDNGVGISKEALGTLFQKYSQDAAVRNDRPRGTGLGLAICREIMELHHGQIAAASEVGQGSTFTIRLPRYEPHQALQQLFQELAAAPAPEHPERTVLVVDLQDLAPHAAAARRTLHDMLEECEQVVRRGIARTDHLVVMGPALLVVLARTDRAGAQAMLKRLRGVCAAWARQALGAPAAEALRLGAATSPEDGADPAHLLETARGLS